MLPKLCKNVSKCGANVSHVRRSVFGLDFCSQKPFQNGLINRSESVKPFQKRCKYVCFLSATFFGSSTVRDGFRLFFVLHNVQICLISCTRDPPKSRLKIGRDLNHFVGSIWARFGLRFGSQKPPETPKSYIRRTSQRPANTSQTTPKTRQTRFGPRFCHFGSRILYFVGCICFNFALQGTFLCSKTGTQCPKLLEASISCNIIQ